MAAAGTHLTGDVNLHLAARLWFRTHATNDAVTVLEIGARDVNGRIRDLFPNADYLGLDIVAGPNVDVVADAASWEPDRQYDIVLCAEVLEHAEQWRDIIKTCWRALKPGGTLLLTAASNGRAPHSAHGENGPPGEDEWYENIEPGELMRAADGFLFVLVDIAGEDVRLKAVK